MKGHIRERGKGNWYAVIDVRDPETGRRKRKWNSLDAKNKRAAETECAGLITGMKGGTYVEPNKATLGEYLERWLGHVRAQVAPKTHERYTEIVKKNIKPVLGNVTLNKLQPHQISEAYAKALDSGRCDGKGGLSPATVVYWHRILRHALKQAVLWNLLHRNPADAVKPPKVERKRPDTYDADEAVQALQTLRPTRMLVPTILGMLCGLRRGEIAALRWHSVDLDRGHLAVVASIEQLAGKNKVREKETKGKRHRTIALSKQVVAELRAHKKRQAEELLRAGIRMGRDQHVVAKEDGSPLQPRTLTQEWRRLLGVHTLRRIKLHNTRHSHASHMLASNIHPKIVQERLGHSTIATTMDIYSHLMPNMQQDAVERVDDALQQALEKRAKKEG